MENELGLNCKLFIKLVRFIKSQCIWNSFSSILVISWAFKLKTADENRESQKAIAEELVFKKITYKHQNCIHDLF